MTQSIQLVLNIISYLKQYIELMLAQFKSGNSSQIDSNSQVQFKDLLTNYKNINEILDLDDIIDQVQSNNFVFAEFIQNNQEFLKGLIKYIIEEPNQFEIDHKVYYKYPFVSSELLVCLQDNEIDLFFDENEEIKESNIFLYLLKIFQNDKNKQLNLTILGYFSKFFLRILALRQNKLIQVLCNNNSIIINILNHLYSDSLLELTYQIFEIQQSNNQLNILRVTILTHILKILQNQSINQYVNINGCILIKQILCNNLSSECIDVIYEEKNLQIIIELIKKQNQNEIYSSYLGVLYELIKARPENKNFKNSLNEILSGMIDQLKDKSDLIQVNTTFGGKQILLGSNNLKIIEIVNLCVKIEDNLIIQEIICNQKMVFLLFDLMMKQQWNDFLHQLVCKFILQVLSSNSITLIKKNLLEESPFINFLIDCILIDDFVMPGQSQRKTRRAFKSHLLQLANQMILMKKKDNYLEEVLCQNQKWNEFRETHLIKINEKSQGFLGGNDPRMEESYKVQIKDSAKLQYDDIQV